MKFKTFGYNTKASHSAAIFEHGTEAANKEACGPSTEGVVVGSSEWIWLTEENGRRIAAALTYFSQTSTEEMERLARELTAKHERSKRK